jgi:hypothetical protein
MHLLRVGYIDITFSTGLDIAITLESVGYELPISREEVAQISFIGITGKQHDGFEAIG